MQSESEFRKAVADLRIAIAAVDVALFTILDGALHVFLIPVHRPPHYQNLQGLPGGIINANETSEDAVLRHLQEKAGIARVHIEQLYTFSDPNRDTRSRSISIAYIALVAPGDIPDTQSGSGWLPVKQLPKLAYDHDEIISVAIDRLRGKLIYTNIIANLLPRHFTLTELQAAYEIILDRKLDKRNFRKKMLSVGLIKEAGGKKTTTSRPAQLYSFTNKGLVVIPEVRAAL